MNTSMPKPGSEVHLVMREHSAYRYAKPTWILDGTVIDTFQWEKDPGTFSVMVPFDQVPLRSIRMKNVVSINGELVRGWDELQGAQIQRWSVESASGPGKYDVTFDGHRWHCECKGFAYHMHCHHLRMIQMGLQ